MVKKGFKFNLLCSYLTKYLTIKNVQVQRLFSFNINSDRVLYRYPMELLLNQITYDTDDH